MNLAGQTLGQYQIIRQLGRGAMGIVYEAEDANQQIVAVKVMHPDYVLDMDLRARFEREIRTLLTLEHPNIVRVFDYGMQEDKVYFVMQLISGQTLSHTMMRRSYSPIAVWEVLQPLCGALHYAHEVGVLHRDVKPNNVLLERVSNHLQVYLMDFGLAKRPGADATLTETGISIGTPEYMSPEAALGENIDYRTDIYSLAVMIYEMLLGALPFDRKEPHLNALAHVNEPPPPLSQRNPHFPKALEQVVMRSLSKAPAKRHQSVTQFANDFYNTLIQLPPEEADADYWIV